MEKFRQTLQLRLRLAGLYNAVFLMVVASGFVHLNNGGNGHLQEFIIGCNVGFCIGIQLLVIYYMGKYSQALKSNEKLKKLYIYENDERRKLIKAQVGGVGINVVIGGLAIAMIGAGFFNNTVFFAFLGALIFSALVKGTLKLYFNRKI